MRLILLVLCASKPTLQVAWHEAVPESVALKQQWERQFDSSEKAIAWCHSLEKEFTYLDRYFDVRFVEASEISALSHYPSYRIGNEKWRPLSKVTGIPGVGIIALYEIAHNHRELVEIEHRRADHWKRCAKCTTELDSFGADPDGDLVFVYWTFCKDAPKAVLFDTKRWERR